MSSQPLQPAVFHLDQDEAAPQGTVRKTLVASPRLQVVLFSLEEGGAIAEHTAPSEATIHILKGRGEIVLDGTAYEAMPGSLYVMPAGLVHAVKATEKLVFLLTIAK